MSTKPRIVFPAAAAALLVMALAGCTAAETAPDASKSSHATPSGEATGMTPIEQLLWGDPDDVAADLKKKEEIIQQCMSEQGFTYVVTDATPPRGTFDLQKLPSREWVKEHGSGSVEQALESAASLDDPAAGDPNEAYVESLSASQQEAYNHALYGAEGWSDGDRNWKNNGCSGKADHTLHPEQEKPMPAIVDDAFAFQESLDSDPRVVALDKEVKACMAEGGFTPPTQVAGTGDASTDIYAYLEAHPSATADDPGVVKLKQAEIAMVLAALDCYDETDYVSRRSAIITELENAYIDEHKKELEEARLWLTGQ